MKSKLSYFNGGYTSSNYSIEAGELRTGALILVEGSHTDSKNRKHNFNKDRIQRIAEKTNALFESGGNIPLLQDHVKTIDNTVGNLESPVWVDIITEENLPNKKAKYLIGKLGIFTDEIAIKTQSAIEKVSKNIVKTISAGLDIATDTIREISLTSTPAIAGMALYKSNYSEAEFESTNALTFDDLDNTDNEIAQLETMYEELTNKLWVITKNIQMADEEMLQGANPIELQMQAIQDFQDRFLELIGNDEEEEQENTYQDPRMQMRGQGYNPNSQFKSAPISAFSMADMENINAEFGYRKALTGALSSLRTRQKTGKTIGQIASRFGSKMMNATKGKLSGLNRGIKRVGSTVMGSGNLRGQGTKLSDNQVNRASRVINNTGGRKLTKTGNYTVSANAQTKRTQYRTKNTYIPNSPLQQ